jgi:hypothetical protein
VPLATIQRSRQPRREVAEPLPRGPCIYTSEFLIHKSRVSATLAGLRRASGSTPSDSAAPRHRNSRTESCASHNRPPNGIEGDLPLRHAAFTPHCHSFVMRVLPDRSRASKPWVMSPADIFARPRRPTSRVAANASICIAIRLMNFALPYNQERLNKHAGCFARSIQDAGSPPTPAVLHYIEQLHNYVQLSASFHS